MTYRDRRAARAERLRDWADKRQTEAAATFASHERYRGDHAFNFQPGHIPERARVIAREDRAFASLDKAASMSARAESIERAADHAIYSDDPDAIERLREKLASLEAERTRQVAINAAIRRAVKGTTSHAERAPILAELARAGAMTVRDLESLMSSARAFGTYHDRKPVTFSTDNLGGQITKTRERIAYLSRPVVARALRVIAARRGGTCGACGQSFAVGASISPLPESCGLSGWGHTACAQAES